MSLPSTSSMLKKFNGFSEKYSVIFFITPSVEHCAKFLRLCLCRLSPQKKKTVEDIETCGEKLCDFLLFLINFYSFRQWVLWDQIISIKCDIDFVMNDTKKTKHISGKESVIKSGWGLWKNNDRSQCWTRLFCNFKGDQYCSCSSGI